MSEEVYAAFDLAKLVSERQFTILFAAGDGLEGLRCPPVELRTEDCEEGNACRDCWFGYTKMQALIDLGLIERMDDI